MKKEKQYELDKLVVAFCRRHGTEFEDIKKLVDASLNIIYPPSPGRKLTPAAEEARGKFLEWLPHLQDKFTTKEAAAFLCIDDLSTMANTLRYMQGQGYVKRVGYKDKGVGEVGKREILWQKVK